MINQNIYQKSMRNDFLLNKMLCMKHNLMKMAWISWINKINNKCFSNIQEEGISMLEVGFLILNNKEAMVEERDLKESMVRIIIIKIPIWKNYKIKCHFQTWINSIFKLAKIINLISFYHLNQISIQHKILLDLFINQCKILIYWMLLILKISLKKTEE